jgi:hypothetical protein
MKIRCLTTTAIIALANPATAQFVKNGTFETGTLDNWFFIADPNAEPLMTATVTDFNGSLMFRLNPGHDGSGGWAGGRLEQRITLEERAIYAVSGSFHVQNLRGGTNQNGGRISVWLGSSQIFSTEIGPVPGNEVIHRPFSTTFRTETGGEYLLRITYARPWRNSNPISIYHWTDNLIVAYLPCYANCDNSTASPRLNVEDFLCFISSFADALTLPQAEQLAHYANCDESTSPPILNIDDFTCFLSRFAQGCP